MSWACSTFFCCIPGICMKIWGAVHELGMQHLLLYTRYLHENIRSCSWAGHAVPSAVYQISAWKYEERARSLTCSTFFITGTNLKAYVRSYPCVRHAAPSALYQVLECKYEQQFKSQACNTFCCIPGTCMQYWGVVHEPDMQHLLLFTRYWHANIRSCPWARHAAPSAVYQVLACIYEVLFEQTCTTFFCLIVIACMCE